MSLNMKPIILKMDEIRAVIDGSKTQVRQVVPLDWVQSKVDPLLTHGIAGIWHFWNSGEHESPYQINDILYVRETFRPFSYITMDTEDTGITYRADGESRIWFSEIEDAYSAFNVSWKPSVHLPKIFSRIFLKITNIRVERLNSISETDSIKEGISSFGLHHYKCYADDDYAFPTARQSFLSRWDLFNDKVDFSSKFNPLVFVYEFKVVEIKTLPFKITEEGH